jgi:putative flippase GtrA
MSDPQGKTPADPHPPHAAAPAGLVAQAVFLLRYLFTHPPGQSLRYFNSKDAPFLIQFAKYGFCGVVATLSHTAAAWWFSRHWFPAFHGAPQDVLQWNQIYANLWALPIGNLVAYATNALWVFSGGRHNRWKEFALFSLINLISGVAGILAGPLLREALQTGWWVAQLMLILTSALVNFVCRKFFVFQK